MKKVLIVLSVIILTIFSGFLCFSYGVRDDCIDLVSKTLVNNEVSGKILSSVSNVFPDLSYKQLAIIEDKIDKNENVRAITAKYFDNVIYAVVNDTDIDEPDTKEEILNIVNESLNEVSNEGISTTDDQKQTVINTIVESNVINNVYMNASKNLKSNLTSGQKDLVLFYNAVTSTCFRTSLSLLALIILVGIAFLKKSGYKWLIDLGISYVLAFWLLFIIIRPLLAMESVNITSRVMGKAAVITMSNISRMSFIIGGVGIFSIILYFIIKIVRKDNTSGIEEY